MDYKKKLIELRDSNPDFASVIEDKFPELRDTKPFIRHNQFFIRRQCPTNIYQLKFDDGTDLFSIVNLNHRAWASKFHKEHPHGCGTFNWYLTRTEFKAFLKDGKGRIADIKVISEEDLKLIHGSLFNV